MDERSITENAIIPALGNFVTHLPHIVNLPERFGRAVEASRAPAIDQTHLSSHGWTGAALPANGKLL